MSDKHLFRSKKEWEKFKKEYKDGRFTDYRFYDEPKSYPCVGVMTYEAVGDYGSLYKMEEFVYPSDFTP